MRGLARLHRLAQTLAGRLNGRRLQRLPLKRPRASGAEDIGPDGGLRSRACTAQPFPPANGQLPTASGQLPQSRLSSTPRRCSHPASIPLRSAVGTPTTSARNLRLFPSRQMRMVCGNIGVDLSMSPGPGGTAHRPYGQLGAR